MSLETHTIISYWYWICRNTATRLLILVPTLRLCHWIALNDAGKFQTKKV